MSQAPNIKPLDGRRQRSERSKQAILNACVELMNQGVLVPTAQQISDVAGVPIRSFFRHFPDMESLFTALDETLRAEYEQVFRDTRSEGDLHQRVSAAIRLHAKSYESNRAVVRSTKAQLWRYKTLQKNYRRVQRGLRKDLDRRIPELASLDSNTRELIDALTSYEMWARLRDHQNLSIVKSTKMIESLVLNLLEQG